MSKVICTLPNAGTEINGVKFSPVEGGMLSEDLTAEQAESFLSIPGYAAHQEDLEEEARVKAVAAVEAQKAADAAAQKAAATKPGAKAVPKATKPAKADPVAPAAHVEPAHQGSAQEPDKPGVVISGDDDTTF